MILAVAQHADVGGMEHRMVVFVIQLAVVLLAARLSGLAFRRFLRQPMVMGELVAGMIIGPYALGGISLPGLSPLFEVGAGGFPITPELYSLATLASLILLFLAGLETDLVAFLKYSVAGTAVGIGGVLLSFFLGAQCAVIFGMAGSMLDPVALFLGAASTATSVGITARILAERRKLDSPEGVTILAGAVVDDVLCILTLAIAGGVARVSTTGGEVPWGDLGRLAAETLGFWLAAMALSLALAPRVSKLLKKSHSPEVITAFAFGMALLLSGLTEKAGLAMIIGAYISGLALSRTDLFELIKEQMEGIYNLLVPIFFCVMGMLVDFRAMQGVVFAGVVYALLAIGSKVIGCAVPAYLTQFNARGALRVGIGMMPRGEVALIVAAIGLSGGYLPQDAFGLIIIMTAVTTLSAPPLLMLSLKGPTGVKPRVQAKLQDRTERINIPLPSMDMADILCNHIVSCFRNEGYFVHRVSLDEPTYHFRKDDLAFTLSANQERVVLLATPAQKDFAQLMILESLIDFQDVLAACQKLQHLPELKRQLAKEVFTSKDPKSTP